MDINEIYRSLSINSINEQNKEDIYLRNFNTFLYEKSDKVLVNGELIESKIERLLLKLSNGKGEPNIKNYEASNTLEGLPLTENDFINSERIKIEKINSDNLELIKRKKLLIYKALLTEKAQTEVRQIELEPNDFDTNKWNLKTYLLFSYLIDNYENENNVKYINIYYFLKELTKPNNTEYRLTFIIKDYKTFILERYKVKLTKFERAAYKFDEFEVPKLKDLLKKHNATLK